MVEDSEGGSGVDGVQVGRTGGGRRAQGAGLGRAPWAPPPVAPPDQLYIHLQVGYTLPQCSYIRLHLSRYLILHYILPM